MIRYLKTDVKKHICAIIKKPATIDRETFTFPQFVLQADSKGELTQKIHDYNLCYKINV